jgi:hypothetical protein
LADDGATEIWSANVKLSVRELYAMHAKAFLMDSRKMTYEQLAERLKDYGVTISTQALINKMNRGNFKFEFALQVLAALGVESIQIPQITKSKMQPLPGKAPTDH